MSVSQQNVNGNGIPVLNCTCRPGRLAGKPAPGPLLCAIENGGRSVPPWFPGMEDHSDERYIRWVAEAVMIEGWDLALLVELRNEHHWMVDTDLAEGTITFRKFR